MTDDPANAPPQLEVTRDQFWIWLRAPDPAPYTITGKYLLFSSDQQRLLALAAKELAEHDFHLAKVNVEIAPGSSEHVLCLYYADDSRKHELAWRNDRHYRCNYRYGKPDTATNSGRYSETFLAGLPPELREQFEHGRAHAPQRRRFVPREELTSTFAELEPVDAQQFREDVDAPLRDGD